MNNRFDEITKGLAQSVTRRAPLNSFGGGLAAVSIALVLFSWPATADQNHKRVATLMTYNIYQGTELEHVLAATDLSSFVAGVTTDYANVIATSFPERAQAIAAEIAQNAPDLVALQEVAL